MTKIDFYITDISTQDEYLNFACRLTEKAFRQQCDIYLHTADEQQMKILDQLLWTFRPNSFLPHSSESNFDNRRKKNDGPNAETAAKTGEILVACSGNPNEHHDVLINLTDQTPEFFSRFTRLAEVVMGGDKAKEKSRQRYKYYRDRGYPLEVHNI